MAEGNYQSPYNYGRLPVAASQIEGEPRPSDHKSRCREWGRRMAAYLQLGYTRAEVEELNLFIHEDEDGQIQAVTRRLSPDVRWVCEVDAAAIASGALSLQVDPAKAGPQANRVLEAARRVWDRSGMDGAGMDTDKIRWARNLCIHGEGWIEAINRGDGAVIVWRDPQHVEPVRDRTGTKLQRAIISFETVASPTVNEQTGEVRAGGVERYTRIVSAESVSTFVDGARVEDESGDVGLGVIPICRVAYADVGDGSLSEWSGSGLRGIVAVIDSITTQMQVIGARHASPMMLTKGVAVDDGADLTGVGKVLATPRDADVSWLEPTLNGLQALLGAIEVQRTGVRATKPQFMFTEAGMNASGTALSNRASAFTLLIRPPRESFYRGLSYMLSVAAAVELGVPWSEEMDVLQVDGGAPLPLDETAWSELVALLVERGLMRREDGVRILQGLGVLPQVDPSQYAADALAESQGEMGAAADLASRIRGGGAGEQPSPEPMAEPVAAVDPAAETLADTALNGAQVDAAVDIVSRVAAGALPRGTGVSMLVEFFQLDPARAERVMGDVGKGFKPQAIDENNTSA